MSGTTEHDVLIAGAGPAGAHAALRLARRGWRVALVDARTFPRRKPCGEFLSPACLPLLADLGLLEELHAAGTARIAGMRIQAGSAGVLGRFGPLGSFSTPLGHGLGIRREVLDAQAVAAAGREPNVTLLLGRRVARVLREPGARRGARRGGRAVGFAVQEPDGSERELRARFVIGADGLQSRVARSLGWAREPRTPTRFAVIARFEGVERRDHAELHVTGRDYFAACPVDGGLFTANLVVDGGALPRGAAALEPFFRERLRGAPALEARLAGARLVEPVSACGPLRAEARRATGPGAALVGDACGFVDPMTGEGLFFAMRGAELLAAAVDELLADPARERSALRSYERARRRELAPRHALARLLQRGLARPGTPERVVGLLARRPALCDLMLGLTGDYVPPRALLSPALWLRALRTAPTS